MSWLAIWFMKKMDTGPTLYGLTEPCLQFCSIWYCLIYSDFQGDFEGASPLLHEPEDSDDVTDAKEYVEDFLRTRLADACGSIGDVDSKLEVMPSSLHFSRHNKLSSARILQYRHVWAARSKSFGSRNDRTYRASWKKNWAILHLDFKILLLQTEIILFPRGHFFAKKCLKTTIKLRSELSNYCWFHTPVHFTLILYDSPVNKILFKIIFVWTKILNNSIILK